MENRRLAVLRFENLPDIEGVEGISAEEAIQAEDVELAALLTGLGVRSELVSWKDRRLLAGEFTDAVIRSTWDYIDRIDDFLDFVDALSESGCQVFNSPEAVRWNSSKRYLLDLAAWGISAVPAFLASEGAWREAAEREGWAAAVIKPIVGAGGKSVRRVSLFDVDSELGRTDADGFLVQPFIESISTYGERSFVYYGCDFSHSVVRKPKDGNFRAHWLYGGSTEAFAPTAEEIRQTDAMLCELPFDPLFARLDVVEIGGRLAINELELIEPSLYTEYAPGSNRRLAERIVESLSGRV